MQLYALISSGHDGLAFNVDARGPALPTLDVDGKRRPVRVGGEVCRRGSARASCTTGSSAIVASTRGCWSGT